MEWGYTGFTMTCVPLSACRQGFRNDLIKLLAQFISYLAFTLMGRVSWALFILVFLASISALWWPQIWPNMGFPNFFLRLLVQFNSNLACIRMGWISLRLFIFLASILALWWPNIWTKMGFLDIKKKISAQFIWYLPFNLWVVSLDFYSYLSLL